MRCWKRRFAESLAAGLLLIATFACEAWFSPRIGMALRAIVVFLYLAVSVPGLVGWNRIGESGREQLIHLVQPDESFDDR